MKYNKSPVAEMTLEGVAINGDRPPPRDNLAFVIDSQNGSEDRATSSTESAVGLLTRISSA